MTQCTRQATRWFRMNYSSYWAIQISSLESLLFADWADWAMSCVAPGCKSGYGSDCKLPPGVTKHIFPKETLARQVSLKQELPQNMLQFTVFFQKAWIDAVPRDDWSPSLCSVLCSLHFTDDDFQVSGIQPVWICSLGNLSCFTVSHTTGGAVRYQSSPKKWRFKAEKAQKRRCAICFCRFFEKHFP